MCINPIIVAALFQSYPKVSIYNGVGDVLRFVFVFGFEVDDGEGGVHAGVKRKNALVLV